MRSQLYRKLERQAGRAANAVCLDLARRVYGEDARQQAWRFENAPEVRKLRQRMAFCASRAAFCEASGN